VLISCQPEIYRIVTREATILASSSRLHRHPTDTHPILHVLGATTVTKYLVQWFLCSGQLLHLTRVITALLT
jgi:hypothetical protein